MENTRRKPTTTDPEWVKARSFRASIGQVAQQWVGPPGLPSQSCIRPLIAAFLNEMPVSMEFLRGVLGLIGAGCAYMMGRSAAAVRRGWQKRSKIGRAH